MQMNVGLCSGLLRIQKHSLEAELLYRALGDDSEQCFLKAVSKVIREYKAAGSWPDKSQCAAG